jgi:hypothetical protein
MFILSGHLGRPVLGGDQCPITSLWKPRARWPSNLGSVLTAPSTTATLNRAFNEMSEEMEATARGACRRRRFTEAILERIPTGVISTRAMAQQTRQPALSDVR